MSTVYNHLLSPSAPQHITPIPTHPSHSRYFHLRPRPLTVARHDSHSHAHRERPSFSDSDHEVPCQNKCIKRAQHNFEFLTSKRTCCLRIVPDNFVDTLPRRNPSQFYKKLNCEGENVGLLLRQAMDGSDVASSGYYIIISCITKVHHACHHSLHCTSVTLACPVLWLGHVY